MKKWISIIALLGLLLVPIFSTSASIDSQYDSIKIIQRVALIEDIDIKDLMGVCGAETVWDATAEGDDGQSFGLCQMQLATAWDFKINGVKFRGTKHDLMDAFTNVTLAAKYIKWCKKHFKGPKRTYACYNRGYGWVKENYRIAWRIGYVKEVIKCYYIRTCRV